MGVPKKIIIGGGISAQKILTEKVQEMATELNTIPGMYTPEIIMGRFIGKKIGYKNNVLLGILLCGVGGIIPIFVENIYVILFVRGVFGFGAGLIASTLLTLIVYFFDGKTRSTMIGMQGSIGGLGSFIATFIAGRLLTYGWNISFYTYFIAFIILGIFAVFVPSVSRDEKLKKAIDNNKEENKIEFNTVLRILGYAGMMFISVSTATLYIIKCSTLVTTIGYGKAQDGSTIIILISGFILGFGYMAFVPYIQDTVHKEFSNHGEIATSIILVGQSSGAFFAPYLGNMINIIVSNITGLFFTGAIFYVGLTLLSLVLAYKVPEKVDIRASID